MLSAADRMELMPFARISSRLGGAIILILGSLMLSLLGSLLWRPQTPDILRLPGSFQAGGAL